MIESILRKARESTSTTMAFFQEQAPAVEGCARALAERFSTGARLFVMGNGGSACDAQHLAVEFQHPIIEKRRPLPALSIACDPALITAVGNDSDFSRVYVESLELHGRSGDVLIAISSSGASANVNRGLRRARELGLYTVGFAGRDGGQMAELCHHCFVVRSWSVHRIQEAHTALLHILWDQIHVAMGEDDVL
jgi:D-sedoheptulose 7-phosphate isomerase